MSNHLENLTGHATYAIDKVTEQPKAVIEWLQDKITIAIIVNSRNHTVTLKIFLIKKKKF